MDREVVRGLEEEEGVRTKGGGGPQDCRQRRPMQPMQLGWHTPLAWLALLPPADSLPTHRAEDVPRTTLAVLVVVVAPYLPAGTS